MSTFDRAELDKMLDAVAAKIKKSPEFYVTSILSGAQCFAIDDRNYMSRAGYEEFKRSQPESNRAHELLTLTSSGTPYCGVWVVDADAFAQQSFAHIEPLLGEQVRTKHEQVFADLIGIASKVHGAKAHEVLQLAFEAARPKREPEPDENAEPREPKGEPALYSLASAVAGASAALFFIAGHIDPAWWAGFWIMLVSIAAFTVASWLGRRG